MLVILTLSLSKGKNPRIFFSSPRLDQGRQSPHPVLHPRSSASIRGRAL